MDKKLTDLEKKTIMEALPQMMAGLRVGGNVTCDELSRAGSDQTSQQGKSSTGDRLRRLNARFHRQWLESCDNRPGMAFVPASEDTLVPVGAMFAFFDDELSRAGGERAVLPPGAPVTNEELEREMSAEYKAWIVDGRNCGFGVPMEEAKRLAEIVVGLRRELVAAKSARGERAGSPNKVSDLLHGGELRSISDAWERYLAYCEELPLDKQQKAGHEAKLLVDAVTAALHSQLAAIEAERAKAEQERDDARAHLSAQFKEMAELRAKLNAVEVARANMEQELAETRALEMNHEGACVRMNAELSTLRASLATAQEEAQRDAGALATLCEFESAARKLHAKAETYQQTHNELGRLLADLDRKRGAR